MKKIVYLLLCTVMILSSCKKESRPYVVQEVTVQLVYPTGSSAKVKEGVDVKMTGKSMSFDAKTDANGKAVFSVPSDLYDITATDVRSDAGIAYILNGVKSGVAVADNWSAGTVVNLDLTESQSSQIVIKELFVGGTPKDDGSGSFDFDKYVVLYNNSSEVANLGGLCLAMAAPFNSAGVNNYYGTDGKLIYEKDGWIPAVQGFWYFKQNVTVQPGKQIVIALNNAVDNSLVHSKSINFNKPEYYATYDIQKFTNVTYYPSPVATIPTSQYLVAEKYATANAWSISVNSPAFFIFNPKETSPAAFAADASKTHVLNVAFTSKMVPVSWVVDAVEVFVLNNTESKKRLTSGIDAGFVYHTNKMGYSIYRNVDEAATKAVAGNSDKLVNSYNFGTVAIGGSTDPSKIDAEASIKNGARIIYKDSNNSTNDFHLRSQASLRN